MGYIPPLHHSSFHHYASQRVLKQEEFKFVQVQKPQFPKLQERVESYKKVINNNQGYKTIAKEIEKNETIESLISKLTGSGRTVNELV